MFATRLVACPPFDMAAPSDTITVLAPPLPRRRSVSVRACVGRRPPGPRPTHHTMQHMTPALPAPYAARIRSAGLCALTTRCSTLRPRSRRRTPRSRLRPWPQWRLEQELRASVFTTPTHEVRYIGRGAAAARRKSPGGRRGWCLPTSACCTSETGTARRRLRLLRPALWRPEGEEQDSSP